MSGTPGASTSAAILDQSSSAQVRGRNSGAGCLFDAGVAVVPAHHVGAAGKQGAGRDQAGLAEPEHGDFLPGKVVIGIEWLEASCYRNFRVDRPASASTTAMIQNRITICGSVQPSCSK